MNKYLYLGPLFCFDKYVGTWRGETIASSPKKANNNLRYQVVTKYGKGYRIDLNPKYISIS